MRRPITYVIEYTQAYLDDPSRMREFADAPPDLLHVGKSVPITHNWGPVRVIAHENQYTGEPRGELNRDDEKA